MENSTQEKSKSPPPPSKLKAFEIIRKNFATAGITPDLMHQPCPLNGTILIEFLMACSGIFSTSVFILYDAQTFTEYTQAVYIGSILTLILFALLIIILKLKNLFEYFNGNDKLINTSEYESCQEYLFSKYMT